MHPLNLKKVNSVAPYSIKTRADQVYYFKTAEVSEGDTKNFAALIIQKSNAQLSEIIAEFDKTINILTNKP